MRPLDPRPRRAAVAGAALAASLAACYALSAAAAARGADLGRSWAAAAPASAASPRHVAAAVVIEDAVSTAVLGVGALLAGWYAATAVAIVCCAAARTAGRRSRRAEARVLRLGAPLLRRALIGAVGLSLGATSAAAGLVPADLPEDLGWAPAPRPPAASVSAAIPATHLVRPGESLWSSAAQSLARRGTETSPRAVAAEWPRWYAANRAVVGADPNLIHPGQRLVAPREGDQR